MPGFPGLNGKTISSYKIERHSKLFFLSEKRVFQVLKEKEVLQERLDLEEKIEILVQKDTRVYRCRPLFKVIARQILCMAAMI